MSTNQAAFPTTDWGLLKNLRGNDPALRAAGLEILARRYWRPVYCFLKRSGHDDADSKDLTQALTFGMPAALSQVSCAATRAPKSGYTEIRTSGGHENLNVSQPSQGLEC